jgi:hypothetical protein
MKKIKSKKLFFCPAALAAIILCAGFFSCLQSVYDTGLMDYVPSTTPVDIKSPIFYAAQGSTSLIIKLRGGVFAASPKGSDFLPDGTGLSVNGTPVRDSDTQVRIPVSPLAEGGNHRLTVTSAALSFPANRVSVEAVKGGWFPVDLGTVNNIFGSALIWSIGYGDGKFVAAGAGGRMACYSTDTRTWTAVLPGTSAGQSGFWDTDTIRAVAYGNGKFVAAGYGAKMAFSATGTDWSGWNESAFGGDSILALVYGDGKFVAAGDNGKMKYSNSGESGTWINTQGTPFGSTSILGLAYRENVRRFVAVGNEGKIAWSDDGVIWTDDGITWSNVTGFASDAINAVAYGNGKFVAAGNGGKIAHSSDGKAWVLAADSKFDSSGVLSVCYGSGKFIAAGHNGKMASSADGETWAAVTQTHFSAKVGTDDGDQISAVTYGGGMFIAGGNRYEHPYEDNRDHAEQTTAKMAYGY